MKYYSAMKRNGVPVHPTMCMNLEHIMLYETSQTLKEKYCMSLLRCGT